MIFDHIGNKDYYNTPLLSSALEALSTLTKNTPDGKYPVNEDCYINVMTIESKSPEESRMEIHHHYIDVHYVLVGEEVAEFTTFNNQEIKDYQEGGDIGFIEGTSNSRIILSEGDFYVTFPNHPHKPSCYNKQPALLKKAVAKIKVACK